MREGANAPSLEHVQPFHELSPAQRDSLAHSCAWKTYRVGQQILSRRDRTTDVYFVVAGSVRAVSYSFEGRAVTYRDIDAGEMFGEFAAIDGAPRSADIVATSDSVIAAMTSEDFWQAIRDHPSVAEHVLHRVTRTARVLTERVFEFSALAVNNRIHAELLRLAREHGDGPTVEIAPAPTHADIASRISATREAVTRELGALERAGMIERHGRRLRVLNVDRLRRLVSEVIES